MRYLVLGAGQIGTQLARDLVGRGDEVVMVRRGEGSVADGVSMVRGDAGDKALVRAAAHQVDAVFHCIHAAYDSRVWARELPGREQVVMDVAASLGIPVVFPESVYAFGAAATDLAEGSPLAPCSPLGDVRADLLRSRAAHRATTISVVASDLFGPTSGAGSVATSTVLKPIAAGHRAGVLADPDAEHSWTYLPDLSAAMIHAADNARRLAPDGDACLHAPTDLPRSMRTMAHDAGLLVNGHPGSISGIPSIALAAVSKTHPMLRELHAQRYLWRNAAVIEPGRLATAEALSPTPWQVALNHSLAALTT